MLKKVLLVLGALVVLFLIVVAMRPADFKIVRTATIAAPDSVLFAQVNDFHNWGAWSPWAKLDPAMKETYDGPASGTGATYAWTGNSDVGEGKMTILENTPSSLVEIKLEFLKPFAATNIAEFSFVPTGNGTTVTWTMTGTNNFMAKGFDLVMNMDKTVGKDFEKGLAGMKAVAEAKAGNQPAPTPTP